MKIKDVLGINNAKLLIGNKEEEFDNFVWDTREDLTNKTFLGLKGEVTNGSLFYQNAFLNGAKTCVLCDINITEEEIAKYSQRNIILVDDTLKFMLELAKRKRESLNIPIIAVTGSVGKTSTKNIVADVLSTKYLVHKTQGNLNTNIGLAVTLLSLNNAEILVLEMGMNHFGEISELSNIAKPTVAVITNVGTAHIGILGSRENILKAKLEILEGLNGPLIINNDTDLLNNLHQAKTITNKIITFSIDNISDYQAKNITYDNKGSHFDILDKHVTNNVIGKHFIYNSLVAFAIGDLFQLEYEEIIKKLANIPLEHDRMELIENKNITIINDTYNASYDSVYYALEVINSFPNRKIAVLGDILELGDFSEEIHRKIGKLIPNFKIDILVLIGKFATYIKEEALKNGFNKDNIKYFLSNEEAISYLNSIKKDQDIILVKASNGMKFKEIVLNIQE